MQTGVQKLSVREKIGYSLGDGAANFFFQTIMMYQVVYFTDVLNLPGGQARTLFLIALFWNGIFDPVMGLIADGSLKLFQARSRLRQRSGGKPWKGSGIAGRSRPMIILSTMLMP